MCQCVCACARVCVCGERETDRERETETERAEVLGRHSVTQSIFCEYKDAAVVYILYSPCLPTFRSITFLLTSPSFLSCRCQRNPAVPTPMPGAGRQPTVFKCLPRRKKERGGKKRKKRKEKKRTKEKKEKQLRFTFRLDRMLASELM